MINETPYHIVCSNEMEELFKFFQNALFQCNSTLFTRRMVVVSGPAMKRWLQRRLADESKVAAGIEVVYLDEVMRFFADLTKSCRPPTRMQLALEIERQIFTLLESELLEDTRHLWQPVLSHFSEDERPLNKRGQRRLVSFADRIATLFGRYGLYGNGFMDEQDLGWQTLLWRRLFGDNLWVTPDQQLNRMVEGLSSLPSQQMQLHLFGMSFLSPLHHRLFTAAAKVLPVTFYQLSPCMSFWSDIRSDWESLALGRRWREKGASSLQQETLEGLLSDRNQLLANFGRMGRESAMFLEEHTSEFSEVYRLPAGSSSCTQYQELMTDFDEEPQPCPLTALKAVKADLLFMRQVDESSKVAVAADDITIQIHKSANALREVEVLYDRLMQIIQQGDKVSPDDIVVMAPDITLYEPFIKMVFDAPESQLKATVLGSPRAVTSSLVADFLKLLSLAKGRFEAEAAMEFFSCPSFVRRHQVSGEELSWLRGWIRRAKVRWGIDPSHRNEVLLDSGCSRGLTDVGACGSWQSGLDKLIVDRVQVMGDASAIAEEPTDTSSLAGADRWLKLLSALRQDLSLLNDGTCFTLGEWTDYLHSLLEAYLESSTDEEETLKGIFNRFLQASTPPLEDARYSFFSISYRLLHWLEKESGYQGDSALDTVRFSSFEPKWMTPAKVVALIGMDEQKLPRGESCSSLNLMKGNLKSDFCPSKNDMDRYLFLEAILLAKDYFVLSYHTEAMDGSGEKGASIFVKEFEDYLGRALEPRSWFTQHSFYPFDAAAFDPASPLKQTYQKSAYRAARAYYCEEKQSVKPLIPNFYGEVEAESPVDLPEEIHIKELLHLAKHPIGAFLSSSLGIYPSGDERWSLCGEDGFVLSPLDNGWFRRELLVKPFDTVVEMLKQKGLMPPGLFGSVALMRLQKQVQKWRTNLEKMAVSPDDFFDIELQRGIDRAQRVSPGLWVAPQITVTTSDGKKVEIVGRLSEITPLGAWVPGTQTFADLAKAWPKMLLLPHLKHAVEKQLLLGDAGKEIKAEETTGLSDYVDYFLESRSNPSPLMPDWIPFIISKDDVGLEKKIRDTVSGNIGFTDEVLQRVFEVKERPNVEAIISRWHPLAARVFEPINALTKRGRR